MRQEALDRLADRLAREMPELALRRMVPMATMTTLRLGGPAELLAEPATPAQVQAVLRAAHEGQVPVTVVGHGSNLLVRDGGIRGLVLRLNRAMSQVEIRKNVLHAEAGAMLPTVSRMAAEQGLQGLVFASGIPGTIGGAALMNAGAYGGEMSQVVTRVEGCRMDGTPVAFGVEELAYGYRTSRLQQEDVVITSVTLRLSPGEREALLAEMAELSERRREKQPLDVPSAGSTFKRPETGYASALIDACGLKGFTIGGAQVSPKHAGFCVNLGGTSADFLALMAHVQQVVWEQKGVRLEPEVRIVGEDAPVTHV